jgi:hypothetical protein
VKTFVSRGRAACRGPHLSQSREQLARGGGLSCEEKTCHARRRLVGGGPSSRELAEDAPNWLGTRRHASDGLDLGPESSSS